MSPYNDLQIQSLLHDSFPRLIQHKDTFCLAASGSLADTCGAFCFLPTSSSQALPLKFWGMGQKSVSSIPPNFKGYTSSSLSDPLKILLTWLELRMKQPFSLFPWRVQWGKIPQLSKLDPTKILSNNNNDISSMPAGRWASQNYFVHHFCKSVMSDHGVMNSPYFFLFDFGTIIKPRQRALLSWYLWVELKSWRCSTCGFYISFWELSQGNQ